MRVTLYDGFSLLSPRGEPFVPGPPTKSLHSNPGLQAPSPGFCPIADAPGRPYEEPPFSCLHLPCTSLSYTHRAPNPRSSPETHVPPGGCTTPFQGTLAWWEGREEQHPTQRCRGGSSNFSYLSPGSWIHERPQYSFRSLHLPHLSQIRH